MQKTEFDFYQRLKNETSVSSSSVPKSISKSKEFQSLLASKIVTKNPAGKGFNYSIEKIDAFNGFFHNRFPHPDIEVTNETESQMKYKDTKASRVEKDTLILVRGTKNISANGITVVLEAPTEQFGFFGFLLQSMEAEKICFVENMQSFLNVEKLLGDQYVYIHFYGRVPRQEVLKKIQCSEYLHFGDYDFTGLNEYLRASEVFEKCDLYVPDGLEELFEKYARKRKEKDVVFENIAGSSVPIVVKIRDLILKSGRFLEQQVLFRGLL